MNPYQSYQSSGITSYTRIDMLLALYDRAIEKLGEAQSVLTQGNKEKALTPLLKAQTLVMGLASGVNPNTEIANKILPLFSFVVTAISEVSLEKVEASINILTNLREGFRAIRSEAVDLERQGMIPRIETTSLVHSIA